MVAGPESFEREKILHMHVMCKYTGMYIAVGIDDDSGDLTFDRNTVTSPISFYSFIPIKS